MNNGFNKIDWSSYGYAMVYMGLPILLFGLSLETDLAVTQTLIWLPLGAGIVVLLLFDRKQLFKFMNPFALQSGRGTARYLGLLGLLAYTFDRVVTADFIKVNGLLNAGLLLIGASVLWYVIRITRFKERGL